MLLGELGQSAGNCIGRVDTVGAGAHAWIAHGMGGFSLSIFADVGIIDLNAFRVILVSPVFD